MNRRKTTSVVAIVFFALMSAASANAVPTPADFRLSPDMSNILDLAEYDSVDRPAGSSYSRPWGIITGDGFSVAGTSYRLWFFDSGLEPSSWDSGTEFLEGLQPIGYYNTNGDVIYDFQAPWFPSNYGLYGDAPSNTVDEGSLEGEYVTVIAQKLGEPTGFYEAHFLNGLLSTGFTLTLQQCDIQITDNQIAAVPEPGSLLLASVGASTVGWLRRRIRRVYK